MARRRRLPARALFSHEASPEGSAKRLGGGGSGSSTIAPGAASSTSQGVSLGAGLAAPALPMADAV